MIEALETPEKEEEIVRKVKSKKRIRGLLIVINALLASYLIFELTSKIIASVSNYVNADGDLILLNNQNAADSLKIYDKYVLKDEVSEVYDYALYGNYLHLSSSRIEVNSYSSFDVLALRNVSSDEVFSSEMNHNLNGTYLNKGIDLSSLDEGDHLVLDTILTPDQQSFPHKGVKIRSSKGVNKTIYTLPDENNQRKKISIKSKDSSPCLVVSVEKVPSLPKDYYDFILYGEDNLTSTFESTLPANLKVLKTNSLALAYASDSSYCISIDDTQEKPLISHLMDYEGEDYVKDVPFGGESLIARQDANKSIRELGGYITFAGSRIKDIDETFEVASHLGDHDKGKLVVVVSSTSSFDSIKTLF